MDIMKRELFQNGTNGILENENIDFGGNGIRQIMEINLTYRDVENILQTKFHINSTLNPRPLWYFDDEFDGVDENKLDDVVIKLRVHSDLI